MSRRPAQLVYALRFAAFCTEHKVAASDLADLVVLIRQSVRAYERANNSDGMAKYGRSVDAVSAKAEQMGLKIDWPGLYPTVASGHPIPCC